MTLVQKWDHLVTKTFIGSKKSSCSQVCKKVMGRQNSNGKVITFKYQDTGLKEIKQGNGKALNAGEGSLKFLIPGKVSFHFLVVATLQ